MLLTLELTFPVVHCHRPRRLPSSDPHGVRYDVDALKRDSQLIAFKLRLQVSQDQAALRRITFNNVLKTRHGSNRYPNISFNKRRHSCAGFVLKMTPRRIPYVSSAACLTVRGLKPSQLVVLCRVQYD